MSDTEKYVEEIERLSAKLAEMERLFRNSRSELRRLWRRVPTTPSSRPNLQDNLKGGN
jgi:plasmid stabilization system protein ParE